MVGECTRERRREDLIAQLIAAGVPCAPVRTIREVAADPELVQRGLVRDASFGSDTIKVLGSAIKMSPRDSDEQPTRVPKLGEDTAEVLARIGIDGAELEALRKVGAI